MPNGIELITKEDSSASVVSLQAWCRAGSIHESHRLGAGMSHFLEHMLFKGTDRREASDIAKSVQALGGYINAYTSFDRTVYWIDAPSSGASGCLDILCDVVGHASIPEEEFEKEREVIRREIAMGEDSPDSVLSKMLFRNLRMKHPCRYPVIGHLDLFNQLSRDDLYDYYRTRYSPENLFLVVVGDIDSDAVYDDVSKHLGELERQPIPSSIFPEEPRQIGIRRDDQVFPTDLYRARFGWQVPDVTHPDVPALDLLASVLGGGRSSRLFQSIREEKQLAHSVSAYAYTPSFDGVFAITFDSEADKAAATEQEVFAELEKLKNEGVSQEEIAKVRSQALSSQFSTLSSMRAQASDLGSNWILTRNLDFTRDYVDHLQALSPDDVTEAARKYLPFHTYTRVSLRPAESDAQPASSKSATASRSEDIRKVELENGLTVLLLEDKRVPFVQATAAFRGGLLAETSANSGITQLMGRLLTRDTKKRSGRELVEAIESVGGGISGSIGNNTFGVGVGAMRNDLDLVVDLLGESVLEPAFLEEVLEKEKSFQISGIKAEADRPFTIAMKQLRKELYGIHPYGLESSGTPESVSSVKRVDIQQFHSQLVTGRNGVLGVFGDLDLNQAEDLVRSRFESGMPPGEKQFAGSGMFSLPEKYGQIAQMTHEKEQAILLIAFPTVDLTHQDNPSLEMIDEACSDMASRMFIRIREELGLAYSVGSMRMLGLEPGYLAFYCATSPEKLDLVQAEMLDEIQKIADNGLETEEFERAKASWLGREILQLQSAKQLAGVATIDELVGLGWDNYRKSPDVIRNLTADTIHETAAKYLRSDNRVIVRLTN